MGEASDGVAAVVAIEVAQQPYDLLLTDVVMPGRLGGKALADEVVRRWPRTGMARPGRRQRDAECLAMVNARAAGVPVPWPIR